MVEPVHLLDLEEDPNTLKLFRGEVGEKAGSDVLQNLIQDWFWRSRESSAHRVSVGWGRGGEIIKEENLNSVERAEWRKRREWLD